MLSIKRLFYLLFFVGLVSAIFFIYNINEERAKNVKIESKDIVKSELIQNADVSVTGGETFLVFGDAKKDIYKDIYNNTTRLLDDLKLNYYKYEDIPQDIKSYDVQTTTIIFCDEITSDYVELTWLGEFINSGGKVIFAAGLPEGYTDSYLWSYLGIQEKTVRVNYKNFKFVNQFLPIQEENLTYGDFSASTWIEISEKATVYVEEDDSGVPLIYSMKNGDGSICMINGTFLTNPLSSGFLVGAISVISEDFIYPVIGEKLVYLDNFPMVTFVSDKVAMNLYGRDSESFVRDVIWPEFMGIAVREDIDYTSSVLVVSNDEKNFPTIKDSLFSTIGKSALQYNGEVAFTADYSRAGGPVYNETFLQEFQKLFVNYKVQSMTLNSNHFSEEMINIPGTEIVGVRGDLNRTDNELHFFVNNEYFILPVATYGNNMDDGNLLAEYSVLGAYGMISHIFDINTMITTDGTTASWDLAKEQISVFEKMLAKKTGFLNSTTLSQCYDTVNSYVNLSFDWSIDNNILTLRCNNFVEGQKFFYYTNRVIESSKNLSYLEIGNGYYQIELLDSEANIYFVEEE